MWDQIKKWAKRFERPLIILGGTSVLTFFLLHLDFNLLEATLYDLRFSQGYQNKPSSEIVLISLDDLTARELNEFSPFPIQYHIQFLKNLQNSHPKGIGYLVDMNQVIQLAPQSKKNELDAYFNTVRNLEAQGTVFLLGTPFDVTGEIVPPQPLDGLPHSIAVMHKEGNVFAEDKITRRGLLSLYGQPTFHLQLAQRLGRIKKEERPPGGFYIPEIDAEYFFFRYHGNTIYNPKLPREGPYKKFSFLDILRNRVPPEQIKNKIVLVGKISSDDSSDFTFTPYSNASFSNPKLIVHANILDSILNKDGIQRAPKLVNWVITFLVTATVIGWTLTSTPLYGVFATLILSLIFIGFSQFFFQIQGFWIKESQPLIGIFLSYYLAVPYRLIREYKKRSDYQRRNLILTQVEELKTNFLSLVTHDLKTPVARIQGLAEVLLRKNLIYKDLKDRETLTHIIESTEELNHFISSILELNKIESNHLHLCFESKDMNRLIERCIEGFTTQAQTKKIQFVTALETLFPLRIDTALMSKVLNNLIDNAIKYSSPGSTISISSQEESNQIIISVRDQGIGMTPEECENLFTRFYRAKNEATEKTTGTGLGLYLTRYFIEAHHGHIEVKSQSGVGTEFKIFLPLQEDSNLAHKNKKPTLSSQFSLTEALDV